MKNSRSTSIIETIVTDQLRWSGHVMRRDEKTTPEKILDLKVKDLGGSHEHPG